MKSGTRRIFSGILVIALAITLSVPAFATEYELKSFSDVSPNAWYYDAVMRAVELGLIYGTKDPDENGVSEFDPNGTMTRAAFVVVVMRAIAPDELNGRENAGAGKYWYSNAVQLAVDLGILERMDFDGVSDPKHMNQAITREEMAHILAKATSYLGLEKINKIYTVHIKDWDLVSPNYQLDVLAAYRTGLITGYDYPGNFGVRDTMTRAQACIVANRLLDADSRIAVYLGPHIEVEPGPDSEKIWSILKMPKREYKTYSYKEVDPADRTTYYGYYINGQNIQQQTWKEGELHAPPKEGDIIIAKDGTKYTIQATYVERYCRCILGFGIPCDIWTGTVTPSGSVLKIGSWGGFWGNDFSTMHRNTATGEVHTRVEWSALRDSGLIKRPTQDGTYDGQVSGYYIWKVYQGAFGPEADWSFETESK